MKIIIRNILFVLLLALLVSACSSTSSTVASTTTTSKTIFKTQRRAYHDCLIEHGVVFPAKLHSSTSTSTSSASSITSGSSTATSNSFKSLRATPTYIEAAKVCKYLKPKKRK